MSVEQTDVVDFLVRQPKAQELILVMIETRAWKSTPEALHQLNRKFAGYAECIMSGGLFEQYPQYSKCPVCIQLDHFSPITLEVAAVLTQWAGKLSGIPVKVSSLRQYWNPLVRSFKTVMAKFKGG